MVAMQTDVNCPLDCDVLVFPMPIGEQWACAVVDMRKHHITYYSSFKVPVEIPYNPTVVSVM